MDIAITARNASITDRFRAYAEEKLEKVALLLPRATSVTLKVTRHADPHVQSGGGRVEITVHGPGPVIRAEAEGPDKYIAFDTAFHRIMERARRVHDKKTDHRNAHRTSTHELASTGFEQIDVRPADGELIDGVAAATTVVDDAGEHEQESEWSPVVIREKLFPEKTMKVRDAVDQMELVGHPFYLFTDAESGRASVVYRRKGWSYGVIALDSDAIDDSDD